MRIVTLAIAALFLCSCGSSTKSSRLGDLSEDDGGGADGAGEKDGAVDAAENTDTNPLCLELQCEKSGLVCDVLSLSCVNCDPLHECRKGYYCEEGSGTCLQQLCPPGQKGCIGKMVQFQCNDLGSGTEWQTSCDDQSVCTAGDHCADGECVYDSTLECDAGKDKCKEAFCDPLKGCIIQSIVASCKDLNLCTEDSCDPDVGCVNKPLSDIDCDDLDPCTLNDRCSEGKCAGHELPNCGCGSLELSADNSGVVLDRTAGLFDRQLFFVDLWYRGAEGFAGGRLAGFASPDGKMVFDIVLGADGKAQLRIDPKGRAPLLLNGKAVAMENWHHVAFQKSQGLLKLYVDGKSTATAALDQWPVQTNGVFFLGSPDGSPAGEKSARVQVHGVRVGKDALLTDPYSPEENPSADLAVLLWPMNQTLSDTVFDMASRQYDAWLSGGAGWTPGSPGKVCAPLPDYPPGMAKLDLQPADPGFGEALHCIRTKDSIDEEVDPITYTYSWYRNSVVEVGQSGVDLSPSVILGCPPFDCQNCERWTCGVQANDGSSNGQTAWSKQVVVGVKTCKPCDGAVYGSSCYKWVQAAVPFDTADSACKSWGGHLVTIGSKGENQFVLGLISGFSWIGLNDRAKEGTYVWANGEAVAVNLKDFWASGQPDNAFDLEDCVEMNKAGAEAGKWSDINCTSNPLSWAPVGYVCEKEWSPI